jgi:NDP-sugar pyrophosphorylase family protein
MAYVETAPIRDVGMSLWHYWEANMALLTGRVHWPGIAPDAAGVLCAETAQIGAGAQLQQSALGRGARVASGVRIERSVLWPGAHVERDVRSAVVLPDGRLIQIE